MAETGGLFRLAVKLMQESATTNKEAYILSLIYRDCIPLVNALGRHFQIRDDYINLTCTTVVYILTFSMRPPKVTVKI